jgi:lipopolysaccharide export system permease protein
MRTVRRLFYRDIAGSVFFVALAFVALFFFIDFVDELTDRRSREAGAARAAAHAVLQIPGHLYELMPIAVLIGTIYALSRMAQSSEFTILRTAGLGPGRALRLLAVAGLAFAAVTFALGDALAPWTEREAVLLKAKDSGALAVGRTGAWLKERRDEAGAAVSVAVNVSGASPSGVLSGVQIFEFDITSGVLRRRIDAASATVHRDKWLLSGGQATSWPSAEALASTKAPKVMTAPFEQLEWPSRLGAEVVAAAVLPLQTMNTLDLWRYSRHLGAQEQASRRHEIQFWKRAVYPLACVVMVALALPFAYLRARAGGISLKVFGGIMLGISFVLTNNLTGHLGVLRGWEPWVAATAPSLAYLMIAMAAFSWLVRFR